MHEKNEFNQNVGLLVNGWCPADFPPKTTMKGRHCLLEPLDINKHTADLYASLNFNNQGESWTYLSYGPFDTVQAFQEWLQTKTLEKDGLLFAILDPKNHMPIGTSAYMRITPEHGVLELGHLHFSSFLRKTVAATEAIYLMLLRAFEELGYRRCEWKCNALNQSSQLAAQRLGFKFEGIFRQHNVFKNRNRDTAWFSIIDNEWPALKTKLQKWLHPNNFDANGNQKVRLKDIA